VFKRGLQHETYSSPRRVVVAPPLDKLSVISAPSRDEPAY